MSIRELFGLDGRVAIITGGNGGLGLGMALGLAGAGANIVVAARNMEKTAQAQAEIEALGVKSLGLAVDVNREPGHCGDGGADNRGVRAGGHPGEQRGDDGAEGTAGPER